MTPSPPAAAVGPGSDPASITLVAAVAANGVIGADGGMPWHLPEDLKHFRAVTTGHPMIMGRRTFDSIGRALPGRTTVVVTRDLDWSAPGVEVAHSLHEALARCRGEDVMVVGGGEIYAAAMPLASHLEITQIHAEADGDVRFPAIAPTEWEQVGTQERDGYSFVRYRRRPRPVVELSAMLHDLRAVQRDGRFVYLTRPTGEGIPEGTRAVVVEDEGTTVVLSDQDAWASGVSPPTDEVFAWITLSVVSSLLGVGLTAAVSEALARDGIACNMLAGYHHDHLLVPYDRAHHALQVIAALGHVTR